MSVRYRIVDLLFIYINTYTQINSQACHYFTVNFPLDKIEHMFYIIREEHLWFLRRICDWLQFDNSFGGL
jgi:hypothetical protein